MKFYYTLFLFLVFDNLYAQESISFKWYFNTGDTTIKAKDWKYKALPWEVLETQKGELVFNSFNYWGWRLMKLNPKDGKVIWANGRNQNYPDKSNKMFVLENTFERPDGNIEVLGTKSLLDYFAPLLIGNPVRSVYDITTGKELRYFEPKQPSEANFTVDKPGLSSIYMRDKNKYLLFNVQSFTKDSSLYLRRLDTSMVILDTLAFYKNYKDDKLKDGKLWSASNPNKIDNHFYFMPYILGNSADSTQYKHFVWKFDLNGKRIFSKNVSKDLYYGFNYPSYKSVQDGFLVSGLMDTTYKSFAISSKASNTSMVVKFDTTGAKVWSVKLKHPTGKICDALYTCEDKKRQGYWGFAGNTEEKNPYLYFIDRQGKSKLVCKVTIDGNPEFITATSLWALKNGDLLASFRYQKCQEDSTFTYCWGIGLIERDKLDKLLINTREVIRETLDFQVFPNPADNNVTIKFENDFSGNVYCYNSLGQLCFTKEVKNENVLSLDTQYFPNGIYYIEVANTEIRANQKVVIQH